MEESDIMDKDIKNPKTGNIIKVRTALQLPDDHPANKKAKDMVAKSPAPKGRPTKKGSAKDIEKGTMKAADDANAKMDADAEKEKEKKKGKIKSDPFDKEKEMGKNLGQMDGDDEDSIGDLFKQIDQDPPRNASDDYKLYQQGAEKTKNDILRIKSGEEDWSDIADSKEAAIEYLKGELEDYIQGMESSKNESIKESKQRRYTVKEVRMWMKKLEENRYKRVYNADVRRVAWMVNNEGVELSEMPMSFKKKWSKAQYGRERYLAKEFLQSKEEQMNESKLRDTIRKIIKEQLNEGKLQTQFEIPTREQRKVMTVLRKAKYKEGKDYDFGAARGPKFVLEVPKKLENKILSLLIQKDVRNIHEI